MWMEFGSRVVNFDHALTVYQVDKSIYVTFASTNLIESYSTQAECDASYEEIKQYLINPVRE